MSDAPANTGSGGVPASAPAPQPGPPEMSERDVLAGIEGLLDAEEQPRRRREPAKRPVIRETRQQELSIESGGPEAPQDAGPEEVTGDEEEEQSDPGDDAQEDDQPEQSIDPPVSWSKDEKVLFSQLPPEAQAVIARRESEQNKDFTRKTQEIADTRKAVEATIVELQSERTQYQQNLEQLLRLAMPEVDQFAQIDWQRLANESPADFVKLQAARDYARGRVGAIQQEMQRVSYQQAQAYEQNFANIKKSEAQRLAEKLPIYADPEKGGKYVSELRGYLQEKGFTANEIAQVVDHRLILVADIAMRAERATQARRTAETRRSDTAPAVQRPGSTQGRETSVGRRREQKFHQLRQTGSQKDALSYLMEIL